MAIRYPCPCCEKSTRREFRHGTFEDCVLCGWKDDRVQADDPATQNGANSLSLNEAREKLGKTKLATGWNRPTIDALLISPPDRDDLTAQLFHADYGQFAEISKDQGVVKLSFLNKDAKNINLGCHELAAVLEQAVTNLEDRSE